MLRPFACWCIFFAPLLGPPVCVDGGLQPLETPGLNDRWIFAFSTGHVGTKFLGNPKGYNTENLSDAARICFTFEADRHFKRHPHPASLRKWWQQRWRWQVASSSSSSSNDTHQPTSPGKLVADDLLPWYRKQCDADSIAPCTSPGCVSIHVDLGHHILMGLYPALLEKIGADRVSFLRIRRNRTNAAASFLSSNRIPCNENGDFVLCPWEHGSVLLDSVVEPKTKWGALNEYQRCLWFVDEVEARWVLFQQRHANSLRFLELNWSTKEDVNRMHTEVAAFLSNIVGGGGGNQTVRVKQRTTNKNQHTHDADFTDGKITEYREWERSYDAIMLYSDQTRALIAGQRV